MCILTYEQKKGKKEKASANKAAANPSTRQPRVAKQPADAASLVGLEDKAEAPTSTATIEKVVSSLDFIGLEAKIELQEPKLLDIEDKVEADTTLKVP